MPSGPTSSLPVEPLALAVEHAEELERRRQVAEGLRGILSVLNSNRPLEEILDYIVGEARRLLSADAAAIYRLLPEQILSIQSAQGLSGDYIAAADIPIGMLATGQAVATKHPVSLDNLTELLAQNNPPLDEFGERLIQQLAAQFQSVLSVPMITQGEPTGTLTLYYRTAHRFSQEEIDLAVAFCNQSALAIENANLRERVKVEAVTAERGRLARELHDSVTQMLFSASLIAEVLPSVWDRDQQEGRQALDELRHLTRGALAEMRALLLELRPVGLQNAPLEDLLRQQVEAVAGRMRIPFDLCVEGKLDLPADVRLAMYRIAQEALNNTARHSQATHVEVALHPFGDQARSVELRIQDDGCGFDPNQIPSDHLGLGIMRERAASVKAEIEITSYPGAGTGVRVLWRAPESKPSTGGSAAAASA